MVGVAHGFRRKTDMLSNRRRRWSSHVVRALGTDWAMVRAMPRLATGAAGAEASASEVENELRQSFRLSVLPVDDVRAATVQRCSALRRK